jgi:hypothetical protein
MFAKKHGGLVTTLLILLEATIAFFLIGDVVRFMIFSLTLALATMFIGYLLGELF